VFNAKSNNFFAIMAAVIALLVTNWKNFFSFYVTYDENPPSTATTAGALTKATAPKTLTRVNSLESFMQFCTPYISNPTVSLIVRLIAGKSRINFKATYDLFVAQGYTGASLVSVFWNFLTFTINEHLEALSSHTVLNYVHNVITKEMNNGVLMLTVKGKTSLNDYEMLAVETLLLAKYGSQPILITFETPEILGFTSFFGNTEASQKFTNEVAANYNETEAQYENSGTWNNVGDVVYSVNSAIPTEKRAEILNSIIAASLSEIGEFEFKPSELTTA